MSQPSTPPVIAITGVSGAAGSRVARLLSGPQQPLVLVGRDAARMPHLGHAEIRLASGYADTAAMTEALRGCESLFLVSGRESAHRVAEHTSAVEAAVAAGVQRVVYLSFQGAAPDCTFTFGRDHWRTEQLIRSTGLYFTFLRDSFYFSAVVALCGDDGAIRGPGGDGAVAAVDHDDVAAVAAGVLSVRDYDGQTLDVTGPQAITLQQAADQLSTASRRTIEHVRETPAEALASRAHYGAPDFEVRGWISSYEAMAKGEVDGVSDTVRRICRRPPITFATYLERHPDACARLRRP